MQNLPWNPPNPAVRAASVRRDGQAICLPTDLLTAAPKCAVGCILEFTQLNYGQNLCPFTSSLTYLCTSPTTSGLTIGEGSIQCLVSRCTGDDLQNTGVYNICDSVPGAVAKTVSVITATIQPATTASVMATSLPPLIGNPTSTQEVTSIVLASGMPSLAAPAATPSSNNPFTSSSAVTTAAQTSSQPRPSGTAVAASDKVSPPPGLSNGQIAGIGVGSALISFLIMGLIFWRCRRREKLQRRRSVRWSMHGTRTPPPNYGGPPPDLPVTAKSPENGFLGPPSSNRFYASAPAEEKRRSFWRKSIKPEDIGVAVAPGVVEAGSPSSFASQQSLAKLLPKIPEKLPTKASTALWPAPLDLEASRNRQSHIFRPVSESTVFDEDIEANTALPRSRSSYARQSISDMYLQKTTREGQLPAPLQLNPVNSDDHRGPAMPKEPSPSLRIPLTPTYDNGNVLQPPRAYPPSSWRSQPYDDFDQPAMLSSLPEELSPPKKNVLRKKNSTRTVTKSGKVEDPQEARSIPIRKDSDVSATTEIEEDHTPEELETQLEATRKSKPTAIHVPDSQTFIQTPRSPISNLRYPAIPRSAGISSQAEYVSQPLKRLKVLTSPAQPGPSQPSRDQLVRNGTSFAITDTTSSDGGYMSDQSIEWPVPPRAPQNSMKDVVARLRESSSSSNRGVTSTRGNAINQVMQYGKRTSSLQPPPRLLPKLAVRAAESPTADQAGDLYFKVEM